MRFAFTGHAEAGAAGRRLLYRLDDRFIGMTENQGAIAAYEIDVMITVEVGNGSAFAAVHEVIRQGIKDLTLIRMTPDLIYDQMVGMGMVKKMVFSYAGNPGVGLLRRITDAVENGHPHQLELVEHSHAAMANAYEAGAAGLPLAVFRGYLGAGLKEVNPAIKSITCPYTGEELATVPSVQPDVTFIHAQKANKKGDVLIEGLIGIQKEAVMAAKRAVVTVEEVVDNFDDVHPNAVIFESMPIVADVAWMMSFDLEAAGIEKTDRKSVV